MRWMPWSAHCGCFRDQQQLGQQTQASSALRSFVGPRAGAGTGAPTPKCNSRSAGRGVSSVMATSRDVARSEAVAMNPSSRPKVDDVREREPWARMVADAAPSDHIVQLYQDEDFLNRAVCRFAGAALANGEGLILVPTLTHWNAISTRLEAE